MIKYFLFICAVSAAAYASGEVTFIHSPKSIKFEGNEAVDQSLLKEIYSASLGFTTNENSDWSGLKVINPFHYAEAVVTLVVEGIEDIINVKGHSFGMNTNEDEDVTWLMLERRVRNRFPSQNNTLMRVELSEGPDAVEPYSRILGDIDMPILPEVTFLDLNVTEDRDFVSECALLQELVKKVRDAVTHDGIPDVYWFVLRGLHGVLDLHGEESLATEEAKQILINNIDDLTAAFSTVYDGHVLISLITSDVAHTRQVRSAGEYDAQRGNSSVPDNVAVDYDELYPVIFNIVLWLMVLLVMAVISVSIGFLHMDPGKDSIIYRMTNMKSMKKDN